MKKRAFIKLRRLAEDEGYGVTELAEQTGIKERTLHNRLGNENPQKGWRSFEIAAVCRVLHIPQEKIGEYFFPELGKERNNA